MSYLNHFTGANDSRSVAFAIRKYRVFFPNTPVVTTRFRETVTATTIASPCCLPAWASPPRDCKQGHRVNTACTERSVPGLYEIFNILQVTRKQLPACNTEQPYLASRSVRRDHASREFDVEPQKNEAGSSLFLRELTTNQRQFYLNTKPK